MIQTIQTIQQRLQVTSRTKNSGSLEMCSITAWTYAWGLAPVPAPASLFRCRWLQLWNHLLVPDRHHLLASQWQLGMAHGQQHEMGNLTGCSSINPHRSCWLLPCCLSRAKS